MPLTGATHVPPFAQLDKELAISELLLDESFLNVSTDSYCSEPTMNGFVDS
jgi:hypothetical protein